MDTVPAGLNSWKDSPWSGKIRKGRVYGRGSFDMKGGLAANFAVAVALKRAGVRLGGDLLCESVVDEEYGGGGGTLAGRLRGDNADACAIADPTNLTLYRASRGGYVFDLERQPGFKVVGEAADGRQAVDQASPTKPDVAVLDIAMPNLSGIEAAQRISDALPGTAIIILSMHSDEGYVLRALKAGAKGYLLKDSAEDDLIEAIGAVSSGKAFFSPEISNILVEDYVRELKRRGSVGSYELLTSRERELLQLLAEGKSNKEIAAMLNLSPYTVETHRRNLQDKLNLHTVAELTLYAVRKGLIT